MATHSSILAWRIPMDRGAWWATIYGVTKSQTLLRDFHFHLILELWWWLSGKESACKTGEAGSIPGSGRSPGGRHGDPLHYSCLENPHGQRSLAGYGPWGHKELEMTAAIKHSTQRGNNSSKFVSYTLMYILHQNNNT